MFNTFPQPKPDSAGGLPSPLDWSAYQTVYDLTGTTTFVAANTWKTFVDVAGKGFFKWCRANTFSTTADANPAFRITVDGLSYTFDSPLAGSYQQGNEVNFEIPYKSSLKIEVFNRNTNGDSIICDYLYLSQQSEPNPTKITLLQQSQRKMAYLSTPSTTLSDVVNVTGSGYLLKARFQGYYGGVASYINGDIAIDGTQKMTDRQLFGTGIEDGKQSEFMGPIRFNSSLRVRTRVQASGSPPVCSVWYSLD